MLILPEQVIAFFLAVHRLSFTGKVRRAGKAGLSQTRKRQALAAFSFWGTLGAGGGQYQRHRAVGSPAQTRPPRAGGFVDWDVWVTQVAALK